VQAEAKAEAKVEVKEARRTNTRTSDFASAFFLGTTKITKGTKRIPG
jgi:hypothetical protein